MPVCSEVKQLLSFRVRLVFGNQIVITHPFETNDLLADFVNFIISRTAGLACSVRGEASLAADLAPFLHVEASRCERRSRRSRRSRR